MAVYLSWQSTEGDTDPDRPTARAGHRLVNGVLPLRGERVFLNEAAGYQFHWRSRWMTVDTVEESLTPGNVYLLGRLDQPDPDAGRWVREYVVLRHLLVERRDW